MLKNYLKITFRNLYKQKAFSFLNIFGLTIGITCTILILLFVQDELSYDKFQKNSDRIYRVTREWFNRDGETSLHLARVAPPVGPLLKSDFPDAIEEEVRVLQDYGVFLKKDDKTFTEDKFFWAENSFFKIFSSYRLLKGNPKSALSDPNTVVLTQSAAKKYFGDENPMGKTINYENQADLLVTGIIQDPPANTHFKFDMLASFPTIANFFGEEFMRTNWGSNNYVTYILLPEGFPANSLKEKIPSFLDKHLAENTLREDGHLPDYKPSEFNKLHLQKLTDIHLYSHLTSELEENGDITNVYLFTIIAFAILLIACINFMNLSTARSSKRAREIGMRKVMGAFRKQLIAQFMGESILISFLAAILSLILVSLLLPAYNSFIDKNLQLDLFGNLDALGGLLLITLFTGLVAGSYPSFMLSSFRPVKVLKSNIGKNSSGAMFRKVLVVSQFSVSIILIISMIVVFNQIQYMHNKDLGINKDRIVVLPANQYMRDNLESVKQQLLSNSNVLDVSGSRLIPSNNLLNSWGANLIKKGSTVPINFRLAVHEVDYDFLKTYGIKLVAGRSFSHNFATDDSAAFVLNEAAVKKLGWTPEEAVNQPMNYGSRKGKIIGVVNDFNFESLHNAVVPMIMLINKSGIRRFSVKISGNDIPNTISFLKDKWETWRPNYPFEYNFLDERFEQLYSAENQLGEIFGLFSGLAILIACLGLLGLASYSAERRTKEIGIRKVLGASVPGIVVQFSKEFFTLVALSNIIAWPIAYFAMKSWLGTFAYHINLSLWSFLLSGIIALVIAVATISYQAIKAGYTNPADSLRYE